MMLSRIKVMNWKGRNFDFAPGTLNYCFHGNGYGKTSLLDGIRFGLTGSLPAYDADGCAAEITEAENGLDIYRARSGKSTVCRTGGPDGKAFPEKKANQALADISGVSPENMKLLSSGEIFSRMKPDDFLALLLEFIPEQLTYGTVTSYIDGFSDEMDLALSFYLPDSGNFGIKAIDDASAVMQEARKGMKVSLSRNKQVLASLGPTVPARTLDEIEGELIDVRAAEKSAEDASRLLQEYRTLKARRERQERQIADLKQKLTAGSPEEPAPIEALNAWKQERGMREAERKEIASRQADAQAAIKSLRKSLEHLNKPYCVLSRTLPCTTDKSGAKEEVTKALRAQEELLKKSGADMAACEARITELAALIEKRQAAETAWAARQGLAGQLKTLEESLVPVPKEPPAVSKEGLEARRKALAAEADAARANLQRQKLEAEDRTLEADIATYSALIAALADKGPVKAGVIGFYAQEFTRACNAHKDRAGGFEIMLVPEDGVKAYARTPASKEPVYYTGLSSGEKIMVSFLVLDMLNELTGMRMAFIDNLEQLDRSSLECVHDIITSEEFLEGYDHVFVCGVDSSDILEVFGNDDAVRI